MSDPRIESTEKRADSYGTVALLEDLCQIPGPTGHEAGVRRRLEELWSERGIAPAADAVGNLLGRVGGEGPRVLLQAHMDEIGFVVRYITEDGFLFLDSAQAGERDKPERRFTVGQRALVLSRGEVAAEGAFTAPSGHLLTGDRAQEKVTFADLFVDVGARSRAEAEAMGIHVGSPVVWSSPTAVWGSRIASKALDNRIGLAFAIAAVDALDKQDLTCELWLGATVQEENNLHGARAMARHERFDAVLAIDITLSGDLPALDPTEIDSVLGAGPVVVHQDFEIAYDQPLAWKVIESAKAAGIPIQHGIFNNFMTDGAAFIDSGSPAVAVGPPIRYSHTANEVGDLGDFDATVELLVAFATAAR